MKGDWPVKPTAPFVPGHEGVGTVVDVGRSVKRVKEGDRVGIPWLHTACGYCPHCRTGWETLCASQQNTGYSVDGSFAEYALADPNYVGRLPDKLEWGPAAPILCAGVTVYKGLKETEVKPGEWVAISGIGGLGHMAVQYAKAMGMHVAAIDIHPDKLALATKLGAEIAINAREIDPAAELQKRLGGVHGALEQMVVVGVDDGTPAGQVGSNRDAMLVDFELPGLGIVAVGSERSLAHQFSRTAIGSQRFPCRSHRLLVRRGRLGGRQPQSPAARYGRPAGIRDLLLIMLETKTAADVALLQ